MYLACIWYPFGMYLVCIPRILSMHRTHDYYQYCIMAIIMYQRGSMLLGSQRQSVYLTGASEHAEMSASSAAAKADAANGVTGGGPASHEGGVAEESTVPCCWCGEDIDRVDLNTGLGLGDRQGQSDRPQFFRCLHALPWDHFCHVHCHREAYLRLSADYEMPRAYDECRHICPCHFMDPHTPVEEESEHDDT